MSQRGLASLQDTLRRLGNGGRRPSGALHRRQRLNHERYIGHPGPPARATPRTDLPRHLTQQRNGPRLGSGNTSRQRLNHKWHIGYPGQPTGSPRLPCAQDRPWSRPPHVSWKSSADTERERHITPSANPNREWYIECDRLRQSRLPCMPTLSSRRVSGSCAASAGPFHSHPELVHN
jgi:hypothetical protein